MGPRVVVAMSGGVDSSVAAALLSEQGFDVIGLAMRLAADTSSSGARRRGTCCSHDDFEDARRVAERLHFPFYVIDLRAEFGAGVVNNFVAEYLAGRTPNPCVSCNREIKFSRLWERAAALDADYIATGHYARIEANHGGRFRLLRAIDSAKDQSYFLFNLTEEQLRRTLFPLGAMTKDVVRVRARALGLATADKPESQEICFVPDGDYAAFIERAASPAALRHGNIVDDEGKLLARHDGVHRFTVGQRRGLGVAAAEPLYVRKIDPSSGDVVVGSRTRLTSAGLLANRVNLIPELGSGAQFTAQVKVRYRHPALPASIKMTGSDCAEVRFENGGPAVTPGQACVFYDTDEVLGGGVIERAIEL